MPEVPQIGRGTTLGYKAGTATNYTTLVPIVSIDGPKVTVGEVETTYLGSTTKTYLPTLPEAEYSFTIRHIGVDPGCQALMNMVAQAPVPVVGWQITYPDGSTDSFTGFSKGYEVQGLETEAVVDAVVNVRINGPVTRTFATS